MTGRQTVNPPPWRLREVLSWFVQFGQIRRHSRVLYLPLDPTIVRMYKLKKGDVLKFMLLELRRAPSENEPVRDSQNENIDEGEL